jgi:hypothetical protein
MDAVFVWNERQVLRDQAFMAGGAPSSKASPVSIDGAVLGQYSAEYDNLVLRAPIGRAKAGLDELATRTPPEILWLYQHAVQSTFADFSVFAMAALDAILAKSRPGYTNIVITLFDRCFKSAAGTNERYDNVLDIEKIANPAILPRRVDALATFQRKIHSRPKRQRRDSTRFSSRGGLPTGRS